MHKRRLLSLFCITLLAFGLLSCGKKELKKETPEGRLASEAASLIERLREAYVKKERSRIEDYVTPQMARSILHSMGNFDSVDLTFTPVWMEIEGEKITVNVSWRGSWQASGRVTEDRGMAIFELKGQPLKVDKVLRANPFDVR